MTNTQRAEWFTDKLLVSYHKWRSTLQPGSRAGVRYKGLITKHGGVSAGGGVKAMRQLLDSHSNRRKASGFGAEELVLDMRFRNLFTAKQRKEAKDRLAESK